MTLRTFRTSLRALHTLRNSPFSSPIIASFSAPQSDPPPFRIPTHRPAPGRRDGRTIALRACLRWEDASADDLDEALSREGVGADARELGLARELALGAVAWCRLYDVLADRFLKPGSQPTALRWALRLIAHQLFALDRIPPHAAVGSTVDALRQVGPAAVAGVLNAVGRKLADLRLAERQGDGPLGRLAAANQPTALGERLSLPDRLIADLTPVLPTGDAERDLTALVTMAPICTRSRPGIAPLVGRTIRKQDGPWTWWDDPAEAIAGPVADGRAVVQDRSQGKVAELAKARPGELVLDLCAAPGGKARALAESGAIVVAGDTAPDKVTAMAAIPGLPLSRLVAQDGRKPAFAPQSFDVVVVDAPCSNTGVLGRRVEARWRYDAEHLQILERRQKELLASGAALVKPDGRLVYSTCSVSPRENQAIAHALPGWRILAEQRSWPDAWQAGGYVAVLVRTG